MDKDSITYTLPDKKVKEIMAEKVLTIEKEAPLEELIKLFKEYHYHGFPVLHNGKIVGIVTKIDLLKNFSEVGVFSRGGWSKIFSTYVKDIMTLNPRSAKPDTYTNEALDTMLNNDIKLLPVIEEDRLVGIISYSDIANHIQIVSR
ncbi:MAG: CBS domain-containing protein [Candidatus Hydrothermarchaeaceae archaeon]